LFISRLPTAIPGDAKTYPLVIASEAKQSRLVPAEKFWIASLRSQ
jgi:hypothetical protein